MQCQVLIINSPLFEDKNKEAIEDSIPPLGLGYIATALRLNGLSVILIDAVQNNIPIKDLIKTIDKVKPHFVAINVFSTNLTLIKKFVESIKTKTRFIMGGIAARALYCKIFRWNTSNRIDIVFGDGELIIVDIVKDTIHQKPFYQIGRNRYFVVDKNSEYFIRDISDVDLDRSFFAKEPLKNVFGEFEANIITSRGCVHNCTFCSAARSLNKGLPVRKKSLNSIKQELIYLKNLYPKLQSIRILDDLFLKNKKNIISSIKIFSKIELNWRSMAHVNTFKGIRAEVVNELGKSGCKELFIGIESGSDKILKKIKKNHSRAITVESLENIFAAGINIKGYFILGFPGETEDDYNETYKLALLLKEKSQQYGAIFRTSVFQFRPYHGTIIYDEIDKEGSLSSVDIHPNAQLSKMIGRSNFNFHSGNYSRTDTSTLNRYIKKIIDIHNGDKNNEIEENP